MLFNSIVFIFAYLPIVLIGYYAISASPFNFVRLQFLALASLVFYGYWAPEYVILIVFAMCVNYVIALIMSRERTLDSTRKLLVSIGIIFNLGLLFYFKYFNFFIDNVNYVAGTNITIESIILPLAISFFTFQKIAFLFDLYRRKITLESFGNFSAFVLFFPQLIAGPVVHYSEVSPQLKDRPKLNAAAANILVGLTIFGIGIFKKTVLADSFALYASPVFDAAAGGAAPSFAGAWIAAFAYTLQIYFDFSGYSDMAIGLARMFGVRFPLNFHSPLRANNMSELWRRWHMTLSRFVQSYIFQPLQVPMARLAAERTRTRLGMFALSTAAPTFLSMLIIGVWHGAGWNFVIFGALHGFYVVANETWTFLRRRFRKKGVVRPTHHVVFARLLTVTAFVFATVPFRAADVGVTLAFFRAMLPFGGFQAQGFDWAAAVPFGAAGAALALIIGYLIVSLAPNTQQIMTRTEPALEWDKWSKVDVPPINIQWNPTWAWTAAAATALFLGVAFIQRGTTEFIYFNF